MLRTRVAMLAALVATGVAALTACGGGTTGTPSAAPAGGADAASSVSFLTGTAQQNGAPTNTGDFADASDTQAAEQWVELDAGSAGNLNPVVLNGKGFLLYRFDKDSPKPPTSTCTADPCAKTWPAVTVKPGGKVFLNGVDRNDVGFIKRPDGSLQVTIGNWPVYRFSGDAQAGDTKGQGVQGTWFGVTPEGGKAQASKEGTDPTTGVDYKTGTAKENGADMTQGDAYPGPRNDEPAMKWIQLTRGSAGGLNPIVHDGAGRTLYRFDKDTPKPPTSNCNGDCKVKWPPVLVKPGSRIFVNGVAAAKIGIITRSDGGRQVTLNGWPLYTFSGDKKPGDINGEGVQGTWFAISPTGGKVLPKGGASATTGQSVPPASSSTNPPASTTSAPPSTVTLGNGSAILDTGLNLSEPQGSFGVSGPGCVANPQPTLVRSIQLSGGPVKLWKGPNCTGQSTIITGNVNDLGTIGFDKQVTSIRFGDK
ncbi:hypothetical protein ACWEOE_21615 [Amycolatopsis sp. NPDC004368]